MAVPKHLEEAVDRLEAAASRIDLAQKMPVTLENLQRVDGRADRLCQSAVGHSPVQQRVDSRKNSRARGPCWSQAVPTG